MEINGKIYNFNEKKTEIAFSELGINDENLKSIFSHFDTNHDEKLSGKELEQAFKMFESFDNTKGKADGKLSDEELKTGISLFPKQIRVSVDAMKTFIKRLAAINNGKNVANELDEQISNASWYKNTIKKLGGINEDNVIEVWNSYSKLQKDTTLASAINDEFFLGSDDIKKHICKPLAERAKKAGVKLNDYSKLDKIDDINNFIKTTIKKIQTAENQRFKSDLQKNAPFYKSDYPQYDNVMNYIEKGLKSHKNNLTQEKKEEIAQMILRKCEEYNISDLSPLITQILNTETGGFVFNKQSMSGNPLYRGVMQVNYDACCSILNMREPIKIKGKTYGGKKQEIYESDHKNIYSQDDELIKKIKEKYPTPSKLFNAMSENVELGFEVGILVFKSRLNITGGNVRRALSMYCGSNYTCDFTRVPKHFNVKSGK